MPADQDASKGYDPTAEEYYHGYGCTIVSTGQKIPIAAGVHREQASARGDGDARHVTRSPSRNRSGCLETAPTTRSAGTTTCWPQGRASRSVQRTKHRRSERHRVQGRSPHRRTQRGRSAEAIDARRDVQPPGVESNEPTTPSGLRPRARSRPRPRPRTSTKCSSRCAFVSLLRSPTTNAETIQEAPSSRYENYSMTPSVCKAVASGQEVS